jgi:hypothetical protein
MTHQPFDVVGWAYAAEHYSHAGILSQLILEGRLAPAAVEALEKSDVAYAVLEIMNLLADTEALDNWESQDSEVHPQPVFRDLLDRESLDGTLINNVKHLGGADWLTWREVLDS